MFQEEVKFYDLFKKLMIVNDFRNDTPQLNRLLLTMGYIVIYWGQANKISSSV